ncbi:MAG: hypothetical protein R2822_28120 [Spirosomataceae bacterium]
MYWEHQEHCAIRKGNMKAVKKLEETQWKLFDLKNDRTEKIDIAVKHPQLVAELDQAWNEWAKRCFVLPKKSK